jgi:hypothetical protein
MCVKCARCSRPFYCEARMIELDNAGKVPAPQRILDVGIIKDSGMYPEHCLYNYKIVNHCFECNPNSSGDY